MPPKVERDELLADYQRVAEKMGERPTMDEYCERGEYSRTVIYGRFDSFADLKAAAGFDPGEHRIDADDLLDDLRRVAEEVGRSPPVEVYDELGEHNSKTLKQRFGNWKETLEAAGLEPTDHSKHFEHLRGVQVGRKRDRKSVPVECSNCGEETMVRPQSSKRYGRHFCDNECFGEFLEREDSWMWEGGDATGECEECGEEYTEVPARIDERRFCSQECMTEWHKREFSGEGHHRWRGGRDPYYGPDWREKRRQARKRDGYECQICGIGQTEHREVFGCSPPVHHIKRISSFDDIGKANELPNLVTLCKTHHKMVEVGNAALPTEHKERFKAWAES